MKNTLIKVLSFMMALTMIVGCFTAVVSAEDCAHANATETVIAPTCAKPGYTLHECADCGESWMDNQVPKSTEHTALEIVPAKEATCTDYGYTEGKKCADCMDEDEYLEGFEPERIEEKKPLNHNFEYVVVESNCTTVGYKAWVCTACELTAGQCAAAEKDDDFEGDNNFVGVENKTYDDFKSEDFQETVDGHEWVYEIVNAIENCKEGLINRTCKDCGESEDIVIAANHGTPITWDWSEYADTYCGEYLIGARCPDCKVLIDNYVDYKGTTDVSDDVDYSLVPNTVSGKHTWADIKTDIVGELHSGTIILENGYGSEVAKDGTVIHLNQNSKYMSITGTFKTKDQLTVAATCDTAGYTVQYCVFCGEIAKNDATVNAHDWKYDEMHIVEDDEYDPKTVCIPEANYVVECANCDEVKVIRLAQAEVLHNMEEVADAAVAATCTTTGSTYKMCTVCTAYFEGEFVEAVDSNGKKPNQEGYAGKKLGDQDFAGYVLETVTAVAGHKYGDWSEYTTDCTLGIYRTKVCSVCEDVYTDLKYAATTVHNFPTSGQIGLVDVAGTCTVGAHKSYKCQNPDCAVVSNTIIGEEGAKNPDNHVWYVTEKVEYVVKTANDATQRTPGQEIVYLDEEGVETKAEVHKTNTAPTCTVAGKYEIVCACGAIEEAVGLTLAHNWGDYHDANKNGKYDAASDPQFRFFPATCTKDGQTAGLYCTVCKAEKIACEPIPKGTEAKYDTVYTNSIYSAETPAKEYVQVVMPHYNTTTGETTTPTSNPTWKTEGDCKTPTITWVIYSCCDLKVETDHGVDATAHKWIDEPNTVESAKNQKIDFVPATCGKAGNHEYKLCEVCGELEIVFDNCTLNNKGVYSCGMTAEAHLAAIQNDDYVIPAKEHTFTVVVDKVDEQCFKPGSTEGMACALCGATQGVEVIPAHGTDGWVKYDVARDYNFDPIDFNEKFNTEVYTDKPTYKPATCTEDSIPAGEYCPLCMKDWTAENWEDPTQYTNYKDLVVDAGSHSVQEIAYVVNYKTVVNDGIISFVDEDGDVVATTKIVDGKVTFVDAYGNPVEFADVKVNIAVKDCTAPAYYIIQCANCDIASMDRDSYKNGTAAHNWSVIAVEYNMAETAGDASGNIKYLCQSESYKQVECEHCDAYKDRESIKAQIAHYYIDGTTKVEMDLSCGSIADFDGKTCALCGWSVDADAEYAGRDLYGNYYYQAGVLGPVHNLTTSAKDATCTEAGYEIIYCRDCKVEIKNEEKPAINPEHELPLIGQTTIVDKNSAVYKKYVKYVVSEKAATATEPGYFEYVCNECGETVKFYNQPVSEGATLTFDVAEGTVAAAGDKLAVNVYISGYEFKFNTLKFNIYHSAGLKLAAENVVKDFAFAAEDNVVATAKQNDGYVSVSIIVPVDVATGEPKDVEITADKAAFLTVYFDVLPTAASAYISDAVVTDALNIELSKELAKLTNNAKKEAKKEEFIDSIEVEAGEYIVDFATAIAGDWDKNGVLDANDSVAIMTAAYAKEANTVLDINNNGFVDLEDHVKFLNFYISDQTALDYLELLGVDYNDYVAAYENKADIDKNGHVNDDDKALIAIALADILDAMAYNELGDVIFEKLVEEIAFALTVVPN